MTSIRSNLLMDSHEEKISLMIEEDKKREAKKMMVQRAKDIQKIKISKTTSCPMVHQVPIHTCLEIWKDSEAVVILDKVPVSLMDSIPKK